MANKKMTYATAIDKALIGEVTPEVIERLNDLKATLAKRSTAKSAKKAEAQDTEKAAIVSALEAIGKAAQVGEIVKIVDMSSQKVTSMLTKLVAEGRVIREVDKKKAFYSVIKAETQETDEVSEDAED